MLFFFFGGGGGGGVCTKARGSENQNVTAARHFYEPSKQTCFCSMKFSRKRTSMEEGIENSIAIIIHYLSHNYQRDSVT